MKWLAGLLVAIVLTMPMANAAEVSSQTEIASTSSLKFKRLGELFNDFIFKVKAILAFNKEAKLEVFKERNAEMKARQQAWLEIKADALEQFKSGNLTAEEKQEILTQIQEEHKSIIKEHLSLTSQIKQFQLKAKAEGDNKLDTKAEEVANEVEESELSQGLELSTFLTIETKGNATLTAEDAKMLVQKELGFKVAEVKTHIEGNTTFYIVSGEETSDAGKYMLTKEFEVWVEANTGVITAVKLNADIEATAEARSSIGIGVG